MAPDIGHIFLTIFLPLDLPFNFSETIFLNSSVRGPRELEHFLEQYFLSPHLE